jgi:hypothetical protein
MKKTALLLTFLFITLFSYSQEVTRGQLLKLFYNAQVAQKNDRIGDAINIYQEIISYAPSLPHSYLALGVLYSVDGYDQNIALSIQSYRQYLELIPKGTDESIHLIINELEEKLKQIEIAQQDSTFLWDDIEESDEIELTALKENELRKEEYNLDNTSVLSMIQQKIAGNSIIALVEKVKVPVKIDNASNEKKKAKSKKTVTRERVIEFQGEIVEIQKKGIIMKLKNNTSVFIPNKKNLLTIYENGKNNILNETEKKRIIDIYYETAVSLYEDGKEKESATYFERILQLEPTKIEPLRVAGEIYSNSTDILDLNLALNYLMFYSQKIDFDNSNYSKTIDRIKDIKYRISNYKNDEPRMKFLKSFEGTWISNYNLFNYELPTWVFNIKFNEDSYSIELHEGSLKYSKDLYSQIESPIIENDSTFLFHFTSGRAYIPSKAKYFGAHIFTGIADPRFIYMANNQEDKVSEERFRRIEEQTAKIHDLLETIKANDLQSAQKTTDEFIFERIYENMFYAQCTETIQIEYNGELTENKDVLDCYFYKIPDNEPFVFLGKDSKLITGSSYTNQHSVSEVEDMMREYNKYIKNSKKGKVNYSNLKYPFHLNEDLNTHLQSLATTDFFSWYSKKVSVNSLKLVGGIILSSTGAIFGSIGMTNSDNELIMTLSETLYRTSNIATMYFLDNAEEMLKVNPAEWNNKMYDVFLQHYNNEILK